MHQKCLYSNWYRSVVPLLICINAFSAKAQNFCANETPFFTETFGTGSTSTSNSDVIGLAYQSTGDLNDGFYRITTNTQQRPEWYSATDHTGNTNGRMLVANGSGETFYKKEISNGTTGFAPGSYAASLFLMNVNTPGTCGTSALLPTITFTVEYNTASSGTTGWILLQSKTAASVPQSATPTWIQVGGVFSIPVKALRVRLTLNDGVSSGCGNDYAVDDIKFATCPAGAPLPVSFLNFSAARQGSGVAIKWSTATEINSKYFDVEKSTDAGNSWNLLNTATAAGTSFNRKDYSSYDAKPLSGDNYYRIKQVDADGNFKYSITVRVNVNVDQIAATVLNNPFTTGIAVDMLSGSSTTLNVKMIDISGKIVVQQNWPVTKGASKQSLNNLSSLSNGLYILSATNSTGDVVFKQKLLKQ